ncbi:MAG: hypothetical protein H7338_07735, partial [Candidatus Sericytochromatia bacterium]|nr:hypothetical protein [Candidatus Sericytochromatia bacterium]
MISSDDEALCWRPEVVAEPLIDRWYAWHVLLSPATAALFLVHAHLRILQTFVQDPDIHLRARQNPAMRSGPFMDHGAERRDEVAALLEQTTGAQGPQLALAEALGSLARQLAEVQGGTMESHYADVP